LIFNFFKRLDIIFETDYGSKRFPIFLEQFLKHLNEKAMNELSKIILIDNKKEDTVHEDEDNNMSQILPDDTPNSKFVISDSIDSDSIDL
jgi:hypothetical protein